MQKELYFDISDEHAGGSLYRVTGDGQAYFLYDHSTYDDKKDEVQVFSTRFTDFEAFWKMLTQSKPWYFQHPMFVHLEQRPFIRELLKTADWSISGNLKWQDSHRRQWTKVLSAPAQYYKGPER